MIFVDTWAWIGLAVKTDQYYKEVTEAHARFVREKRRYVTTDYVLSELITYLYGLGPIENAERFVNALLSSMDAGAYQLVSLSSDQFRRAWRMRQKYHDKPDISFVDFTSMIVMQDLGIHAVFSGDRHFLHVGLGFSLVP
jgi:predicted nucleic acid-binding protein